MKRIVIIILAAAAIICSCTSQKSRSGLEKAIEEEITKTLTEPYKFSIIELEKLDSTIFLTEFDRRMNVFEKRIAQNKIFHDDYYQRGLKKNASIKYDEILKDYEIIAILQAVKERMGDSVYMVAYSDYRVKAEVIINNKAQMLENVYFAITPDNKVLSTSTDRRKLHQATGLVIPGYSEIIKTEPSSTELIQ